MHKNSLMLISAVLTAFLIIPAAHATDPDKRDRGTVIQAEGEAQTKVQNDLVTISLALEKENTDPVRLHNEIQKDVDAALKKAKKATSVKVQTSGYSINPVHPPHESVRHRGIYWIFLEARDFEAALSLAAAMQPFQVKSLSFSVSPERRKTTEKALIAEAIADMREKFSIAAKSLGAQSVTITNVTIGARRYGPVIGPARAGGLATATAKPVIADAGESQVLVTVSGSALAR